VAQPISRVLVYDWRASFLDDMPAVWDQLRPEPRTALVAAQRAATGFGKQADSNPLSRRASRRRADRGILSAHRPEHAAPAKG